MNVLEKFESVFREVATNFGVDLTEVDFGIEQESEHCYLITVAKGQPAQVEARLNIEAAKKLEGAALEACYDEYTRGLAQASALKYRMNLQDLQ